MSFDLDTIKQMIQDHMGDQPYKANCKECGQALDIEPEVDSDYDLTVYVTPCETCLAEAKELCEECGEAF